MRRATAVVLGTLTGTALLVAAKLGNAPIADDAAAVDSGSAVVGGGGPTPSTGPSPSPSRKPKATPTPTATRTRTATPSPTKTAGLKDGTYTAKAAVRGGRFGTLSMSVTIAGGKIETISASEDGGETNCYRGACRTLKPEALAAQSANVASVSGATYTSSAFRAALGAVLGGAKS